MDDKAAYWASVGLSALALLLMVSNVALINSNRAMQIDVNQRQTAINQGTSISQLNQNLVQALADISVKNDDKAIQELLAGQGITFKAKTDETKKK